MNGKMLAHPATQANIHTLRKRGCHFIDPDTWMLACGYEGQGKLAAVETIVDSVISFFKKA